MCHPDPTPSPVSLPLQLLRGWWAPSEPAPRAPATPRPETCCWDEPVACEPPPPAASPSPRRTARPTERYGPLLPPRSETSRRDANSAFTHPLLPTLLQGGVSNTYFRYLSPFQLGWVIALSVVSPRALLCHRHGREEELSTNTVAGKGQQSSGLKHRRENGSFCIQNIPSFPIPRLFSYKLSSYFTCQKWGHKDFHKDLEKLLN